MTIEQGKKVKIEYTGTLEDGTVFDSSEKHGKPLEFEIGAKQVIKGFEDAITGMEVGEEKEITLKPEEAYGPYNDQMIKKIPKDKLPPEPEPKAGMMLMIGLPDGQQMPAKIVEVGDADITLDLNHPLAGKVLNFKLKLVESN